MPNAGLPCAYLIVGITFQVFPKNGDMASMVRASARRRRRAFVCN